MGIRMDQHVGLTKEATEFLARNEIKPAVCNLCERPFPRKLEKIGRYPGMFGDDFPLNRHTLKDGRTADDFLQCAPWSSGPCHFLGLRVSDGTEFTWTEKEIEEWM